MRIGFKIVLGLLGLTLVAGLLTQGPTAPDQAASVQPVAASAPAAPASETRTFEAQDRNDRSAVFQAHSLVEAQLRDPDSAVFDDQRSWLAPANVLVHRINGVPVIICGWVNSRNGFGGMTGDQAYVVDLRDSSVVIEAGAELVKSACSP